MEYMLGYCYRLTLNGGNFKMNGVTTTKCERMNNMFYRSFGYNVVTSTDYLNHGKVELKNWNVSRDNTNYLFYYLRVGWV